MLQSSKRKKTKVRSSPGSSKMSGTSYLMQSRNTSLNITARFEAKRVEIPATKRQEKMMTLPLAGLPEPL